MKIVDGKEERKKGRRKAKVLDMDGNELRVDAPADAWGSLLMGADPSLSMGCGVAEADCTVCEANGQSPERNYDISWRETYEFNTRVKASSFEEALAKAAAIRADSPKLTEAAEWDVDEEDTDVARALEVEAEFIEAGTIECLPALDDFEGGE